MVYSPHVGCECGFIALVSGKEVMGANLALKGIDRGACLTLSPFHGLIVLFNPYDPLT